MKVELLSAIFNWIKLATHLAAGNGLKSWQLPCYHNYIDIETVVFNFIEEWIILKSALCWKLCRSIIFWFASIAAHTSVSNPDLINLFGLYLSLSLILFTSVSLSLCLSVSLSLCPCVVVSAWWIGDLSQWLYLIDWITGPITYTVSISSYFLPFFPFLLLFCFLLPFFLSWNNCFLFPFFYFLKSVSLYFLSILFCFLLSFHLTLFPSLFFSSLLSYFLSCFCCLYSFVHNFYPTRFWLSLYLFLFQYLFSFLFPGFS